MDQGVLVKRQVVDDMAERGGQKLVSDDSSLHKNYQDYMLDGELKAKT